MSFKTIAGMILFSLLLLSLVSCNVILGNPVIVLWTDSEEILPFVDAYNNEQQKYKVTVVYTATPVDELLHSDHTPDLLLNDMLACPQALARLEPLSPLFHENGVDPGNLYTGLRESDSLFAGRTVIPFSFQLPAIVFRKGALADLGTIYYDIKTLAQESAAFKKTEGNRTVALGFSPAWKPEFIMAAGTLFGARFGSNSSGSLVFQEEGMKSSLAFMRDWIARETSGYEGDREFQRKYLYEPDYKLVSEDQGGFTRLGFSMVPSSEISHMPQKAGESVDFRWLSCDKKIPVLENILSFGVVKNASNRLGAYDFLTWIFNPDTQIRVMRLAATQNMKVFGLANGFSTLPRVNEEAIQNQLPVYSGRMPARDSLVFPGIMPDNWEKLKMEVFLPWVNEQLAGKDWTPFPAPAAK